jgi:inner membrane protein
MHSRGHLGMALIFWSPVAFILFQVGRVDWAVFGFIFVETFAMLPDQDMNFPVVTHRGITHTVWFLVAFSAVTGLVGGFIEPDIYVRGIGISSIAVVLGGLTIGSHLFADMLTPMGVKLFGPIPPKISLNAFRASNPFANTGTLVVGVIATGVSVVYGTGVLVI